MVVFTDSKAGAPKDAPAQAQGAIEVVAILRPAPPLPDCVMQKLAFMTELGYIPKPSWYPEVGVVVGATAGDSIRKKCSQRMKRKTRTIVEEEL